MHGSRFVRLHAPDGSFVFIDRSVRHAARVSGRLALRAAAAFFTLLRRDQFAALFLVFSFFGSRAAFPALLLLGMVVGNATLWIYRGELADAARRERGSASHQQSLEEGGDALGAGPPREADRRGERSA
jgi:hypothetical protein